MNVKSIKKYLNIFGEISMSKNHSKPDDNWQYVEDSNSPEHNEALCPLFYTEENSETPMLVDKQGNVYKVANNTFTKNGTAIARVEEEGFKKTVFDFNDPLVEYYNGNIYRAQHRNDTVVIERYNNGTWVTVEEIGFSSRATVFTERLHNGKYYCLDRYNNTYYIFARDVFKSIPLNANYLNNPRLFVYNDYIDLVTSTGVNIYERIYSYHYKYANSNLSILDVNNTGTIVVPSSTSTISFNTQHDITINKTFQTLVCYKDGNKYYEDDVTFQNEITFSEGYTPTLVSGNVYRYNVYRTEYVYHSELLNDPSEENATLTVEWTLDINNAPYPIDVTHYEFTTPDDHSIVFENNLGYITSSEFYNVTPKATVDFSSKTSGGVIYVPTSSIGVTNIRNESIVYINAVKTTATTTQAADFFSQYIMLDDGFYYGFVQPNFPWTPSKTWRGYNFKNHFISEVDNVVTVESVDQKMLDTAYNVFEGISYDIGYGHFRITMLRNTGSEAWTYFAERGKTRTIVYDSLADIATIDCGVTPLNDYINETRFVNNFYCPSGTREPRNDTFAMLVNNGYVSGFSYNGTLLTSWNSVDTETLYYADDDRVFYKDINSGKWTLIEKVVQPVSLTLVEDRYIVMNTTSYFNCYDTQLNEMNKYADDWNMRIFYGVRSGVTAYTSAAYDDWVAASGRNVNFTVVGKKSGIASTVWPAGIFKAGSQAPKFITDETLPIDLYKTNTASAPTYWQSIDNPSTDTSTVQPRVDNDLRYYNAVYPLYNTAYMMRGPSLFAKFVVTGNNKDYMIENNVAYQVLYENIEPMLLTATTGDIYGVENIYVIQSMPYAVIDGKIYSLSYVNGVYQGMDCIINVKGMKYIGSIPTKAYFYSPNNRAIYVFTGDANLTKVKDASAIDDIYYITFNSATQTIYMATNNGLYMLSDQNSYRQDWGTIDNVTFQTDGSSSVVVRTDDGYKLYRLYYEDAEGRKTNKVILNTGLLGAGEGKVFTIDKYNINLFSDQRRNGKLQITSYVLQDNGQIAETTEEKTINSSDWDDEFFCKQIDYTPPKNRGVGIGLSIVSDFAITSINASATVGQETQSASAGWHI